MIDLLSLALAGETHIHPDRRGVTLMHPWEAIPLPPLSLKSGWYQLNVEGSALCLQLYDSARFRLIELSAEPGEPAHVYLQAGSYTPELFAGVRPGRYPLSQAKLVRMDVVQRLTLLGGRLAHALARGISFARLIAHVRRAVKPQTTFGIRSSTYEPRDGLGTLTRQDLQYWQSHTALADGPVFLVTGADHPLNQTYGHYTLDPTAPHDFILKLSPGDRLSADALSLIADLIRRNPNIDVIITDSWVNGRPTTHVAFDPLLYAAGYPTPCAVRKGYAPRGSWPEQQMRHAVLSVPVSTSPILPLHPPPALPPQFQPPVCIVIPTRDRADLLEACLAGLFESTPWPHEVIVVDNGSTEAATQDLFDAYADKGLRVIRADIPFNFSRLCNIGAAAARYDHLVFLNNDVVLHQPDWLAQMMAFAIQPHVGAVGAKLYYSDKRLQHGGVMLGLTQLCGHLWRGLDFESQQMEPRLVITSLRAAVTGALLCVDRRKFDDVGGFDESAFPVTLNDVDLCLKLYKRGWYSVFAAGAEAYHLEGESRGDDEDQTKARRRHAELEAFDAKWHDLIAADPWLPQAVMRSTEVFGLK